MTPAASASAASARDTDGRSARSAKTRDAIADALLDLLTEGNLQPTAREIASRARVSLRSVYVHFEDLEDLYCVAAARHYERILPVLEPAPTTGTLRDRADALMRRRVRLYLQLGNVGRATERQAPFSPTLTRLVHDARSRSKRELERVFSIELDDAAPQRRARNLAIVDALTGPRSWETLRDAHSMEVSEALECLVDAIVAQLEHCK